MDAKPATSRRQVLLLLGLTAVLAALVVFVVLPMLGSGQTGPASTAPATSTRATAPAAPGGAAGRNRSAGPVEQVALAKLQEPWPEPIGSRRNPFTMAPEPPPPSATAPAQKPVESEVTTPVGPPPPPPIPPIRLKFIGMVSGPNRVGKIAALSDGKFVFRGREGEIVEGRYRIGKIGEESIQIEYVDGTGRQTIRLSGK
jgi:hypothetical protein